MRAIQESVAKSRQAALERTLQRQAEEQAAKEVHIAAANVRFETQRKIKGREEENYTNQVGELFGCCQFYDQKCAGDWFYGADRNSSRGMP